MNELQISTIKLEPASIEFNKKQVIDELKSILTKYKNLVFTEDNTADIRKVLAELRKGRKLADDYRKDIKKQLTAPVTAFEKEVKEITTLFDDVIDPINQQLKDYEERRKQEKYDELQTHVDEVVLNLGLEDKFAARLTVEDSYLNKSTPLRQAKESIEFVANNLLNEQKLEIADRENIEAFVKLNNAQHDLNLSVVAYLSQLEYKDVESVKNTIENDVKTELENRAKEDAKKEIEIVEEVTPEPVEEKPKEPSVFDLIGDVTTDSEHTISFVVTTTEERLEMLRGYLKAQNVNWREE